MTDETQPESKGEDQSLDDLLNEWSGDDAGQETGQQQAQQQQAPQEKKEEPAVDPEKVDRALSYIEQQQEREIREQTERDIAEAVKAMKENDAFSKVPDRVVRGALIDQAQSDVRFLNAWQYRHQEPQRFQRTLKALAEDLAKEWESGPDEQLTEDREAARASVRSQSRPQEPDQPDVTRMSDAEIIEHTNRLARENT